MQDGSSRWPPSPALAPGRLMIARPLLSPWSGALGSSPPGISARMLGSQRHVSCLVYSASLMFLLLKFGSGVVLWLTMHGVTLERLPCARALTISLIGGAGMLLLAAAILMGDARMYPYGPGAELQMLASLEAIIVLYFLRGLPEFKNNGGCSFLQWTRGAQVAVRHLSDKDMSQKASVLLFVVCSFILVSSASAQSGQWLTYGHDPQRSGFTAEERAFSTSNVVQLGLVWKTIVPNQPLSMVGLTAPLVVREVKTPNGDQNLLIVAGSSDHLFALNAETGELSWKAEVEGQGARPGASSWLCPLALNDTPVIDLARSRLFVIASDGRVHTVALADGSALIAPIQFVPAFAKMWSLNYSGGVLYTSLSQDCYGAHSGIVALDPDAPGKPVVRFYSAGQCQKFCGAGIFGLGGPSVDFDGFVYGATGDGDFNPAANAFGSSIIKLAPRSLQLAGYYSPANWEYLTRRDLDLGTSTPVIFRWRHRVLSAVGGKEGAIYLTDVAAMSGPNRKAAAYVSPRYTNGQQTFEKSGIWGEMSVWNDSSGQTWLYVPSWGEPTEEAQFPRSYGPVKAGSIMAFKVVGAADGKPALKPEWVSADISVPDPVVIAGGVAFVLGTGENPEQVHNGDISHIVDNRAETTQGHAILYALDARTGRELWSSGDTIGSWTHFSGLAVADGKVFATTYDGAIYAFGLRTPASPAPRTTLIPGPPAQRTDVQALPETPKLETPSVSVPECGATTGVFKQRCAVCHSPDGSGNPSVHTPTFTSSAWQSAKNDVELSDAVKNGTDGGMPAFGDKLTAQQIYQLVHCIVRGFTNPLGR